MQQPYAGRPFSTHDHYQLQTLLNHQLYKLSVAAPRGLTMADPLLVRCDDQGVHVYEIEPWTVAGAPTLLLHVARAAKT